MATLPEFQSARTVQVSPDKPQEEVRYLVLEQNKDLIVPTPGLAKGLFNRLSTEPGSTKERIRQLASRQGIDELSKPVPMASRYYEETCLVAEPDKVLVGELNKWVANPLGLDQTSALQIKTRSA